MDAFQQHMPVYISFVCLPLMTKILFLYVYTTVHTHVETSGSTTSLFFKSCSHLLQPELKWASVKHFVKLFSLQLD